MSDDPQPTQSPSQPESTTPAQPTIEAKQGPTTEAVAHVQNEVPNREELLTRARTFLTSPQIQNQDLTSKRAFLREKGLNEAEIENLLHTLPQPPLSIPPRTYPQPPPSNLPILLLGIVRLFTWLAGGSAALLLLYRRFLYPRIAQTSLARHSLKSHQLSLLQQLTASLSALKEAQSESYSVLPHSDPYKEHEKFAECKSVAEILKKADNGGDAPEFAKLPVISLLRCAIKETNGKSTTEEVFTFLETQIPWLQTEEGLEYEQQLWDTLSTCPLFRKISTASSSSSNIQSDTPLPQSNWEYVPPPPVTSPPLLSSLDTLASELPRNTNTLKSLSQHTLKTMSDFTGYLSTQVYMPYRSSGLGAGIPSINGPTSLEEDLRKEIRALKGLVLNRRSFMPPIPRASSYSSPPVRPSP